MYIIKKFLVVFLFYYRFVTNKNKQYFNGTDIGNPL